MASFDWTGWLYEGSGRVVLSVDSGPGGEQAARNQIDREVLRRGVVVVVARCLRFDGMVRQNYGCEPLLG